MAAIREGDRVAGTTRSGKQVQGEVTGARDHGVEGRAYPGGRRLVVRADDDGQEYGLDASDATVLPDGAR